MLIGPIALMGTLICIRLKRFHQIWWIDWDCPIQVTLIFLQENLLLIACSHWWKLPMMWFSRIEKRVSKVSKVSSTELLTYCFLFLLFSFWPAVHVCVNLTLQLKLMLIEKASPWCISHFQSQFPTGLGCVCFKLRSGDELLIFFFFL